MAVPEKTGVYFKPATREIMERVMEENNITSVSGVINYVFGEYDKILKKRDEEQHALTEEEIRASINAWFVAEEENNETI